MKPAATVVRLCHAVGLATRTRVGRWVAISDVTPAELFDRASRALYGEQYVAPLTHMLGAGKDTVRKWAAGKSEVPAGVWDAPHNEALERADQLTILRGDLLEATTEKMPPATAP